MKIGRLVPCLIKNEQGEIIDTNETTVYNYDNKGQLTSTENNSTKWEYTYDGRGNILTAKEYEND